MKVKALLRYPIKSMLGEELTSAEVSGRGLHGDRVFALVHKETGKVASAKNPRLWRALLTMTATTVDGSVQITGADGEILPEGELSRVLGQPVELTNTPPLGARIDRSVPEEVLRHGVETEVDAVESRLGEGSFFDFAPIHLLTTATLSRIAELSGTSNVERYRPNILVETDESGFVENDWVGKELHIGEALVLHVIVPTPRCAVPTLAHGRLPRDTGALRVLASHNRVVPLESLGPQPCAGVYARVVRPGAIRRGDPVRVV